MSERRWLRPGWPVGTHQELHRDGLPAQDVSQLLNRLVSLGIYNLKVYDA